MTDAGPPHRTESTVSMSRPDGWQEKESVTLLAPDGQANVIFSREPIDPETDTVTYATKQKELLIGEFPAFEARSKLQQFALSTGQVGLIWEFSWTPENGEPVVQIQFYFASGGSGWTATATTPANIAADRRASLIDVLGSMAIDQQP